jgi:hypothetical protein
MISVNNLHLALTEDSIQPAEHGSQNLHVCTCRFQETSLSNIQECLLIMECLARVMCWDGGERKCDVDKRTACTEETYELGCLLSSFLTYFLSVKVGRGNIYWSIQPDSINAHGSLCEWPVDVRCQLNLRDLNRFAKNHKYQISWKSVQKEPRIDRQTDGRTGMTESLVAFRNFANGPENGRH